VMDRVRLVLYVAVGGAVGTLARYGLSFFVQSRAGSAFPFGTLLINITGSTLLGFLMRYGLEGTIATPEVRLLLTTGFCGGYTTFSTFSLETFRLFHGGMKYTALAYIAASVVCWLASVWAGHMMATRINRLKRS
jgi:CrcB protein